VSRADQGGDEGPPREAGGDVDEEFWLRPFDAVPLAHAIALPRPLRFTDDEYVVIREPPSRPRLEVEVMPSAHEDRAAEDVLQDLDQWVIA
jgi:hypothetical protein